MNYYELLEIPYTATTNDVIKAFRAKAKIYHPDSNNPLSNQEHFIKIYEAYKVLTDEKQRNIYDIKINIKKHKIYDEDIKKEHENFVNKAKTEGQRFSKEKFINLIKNSSRNFFGVIFLLLTELIKGLIILFVKVVFIMTLITIIYHLGYLILSTH